ncbi:MAG: glycosyltransferase family 4 protein [Nitrospiria bacterium]
MNILYHHRTQAEDAQGVHIGAMVSAFRRLGHTVRVAALVDGDTSQATSRRGSRWGAIRQMVPPVGYELLQLAYNLYGYWRLCRAIRERRPDLIYERYSLNTLCGVWASRWYGIPLLLEVNAPLYHEESRLGRLRLKGVARWTERWICSNSTWTIAVSDVMRDILIDEGVPADQIVVMPNGVDPLECDPDTSGDAVRARYGLEGTVVVGFIGWFREWHGLDRLLDLVREARQSQPRLRLLLVGDGPAYPALRAHAERHDLLSAVTFTGPIPRGDVAAHIAAMDIAVQPSATEYACPMKILEYMAMGKAIVAPDQPNIREILDDRETAYLFTPGDSDDFRRVLLDAVADEDRGAVGERALAALHARGYLWSANATRALALVFGPGVPRPVPVDPSREWQELPMKGVKS